jgi:ABC-type nitrate/sulfonate/bicarbonate transport system substrate-binding protein
MDKIRLSTSSLKTGIAYYPHYLAQVLGYFEDEQIDVIADAPGHGPFVAEALATGASDSGPGGMWRPLSGRRKAPMWCFAQLVDSCSGVLLAREDQAAGRFEHAMDRALVWLDAHDPLDAPESM